MKSDFTVSAYFFVVLICHIFIYGASAKNTPEFLHYKNMNGPKNLVSVNCIPPSEVASCPTYIGLYSQEDIDMFSINYSGCTDLPGDLEIYDFFGNITNLDGLSGINSIAGVLYIGNNANLTNLNGLENLSSIGGDLYLEFNSALANINALSNLSGGISSLYIVGNSSLPNLAGFEGIQQIANNLNIQDNAGLQNLNGLNNLSTIGGEVSISNNNSLLSLSGLNGVQEILGSLSIGNNFHLNLNGLNNLTTIGGELSISNNNSLLSLSGLDGVQEILGSLYIRDNINLLSLNGLNNLNSIGGGLTISSNVSLSDISALINVSGSVSSLTIHDNLIPNLTGLGGIESITGNFNLSADPFRLNSSLIDLSGLENLNSIQGQLNIANIRLQDISALSNVSGTISSIYIVGTFLTTLEGLNGITEISGDLNIQGTYLTSLSGLSNLSNIGGALYLIGNHSLTNINDLSNLTGFIPTVSISGNSKFTNIEGLNNLTGITSSLSITNNSMLSTCDILLVCNILLNSSIYVNISNNSTGCNTTTEVIERCVGLGCTSVNSPQNGSNYVYLDANLSWSEAYGATGYKIRIGTSPGGDQLLVLTDLGNVTAFQPANPFPFETQIFVQIFPYNESSEFTTCSEISFTTIPEVLPCATLLSPANGANVNIASFSTVLAFTWASIIPGMSYGFYLGSSPEEATLITIVTGTSMPVTQGMFDTLFAEKQTYFWFVVPLESSPDIAVCQQSARSFTLNCYNFTYNHQQIVATDGDTEIQMSSLSPFQLHDITVSIDIYNGIFDPLPFMSVDTFPGVYLPSSNWLKSIPGKPTGGNLRRTCLDGTLLTLSSLFPATNFNYCSSCINYPAPEGPPVINPRCVIINQDQTINLTMKSAYLLPGNYDFNGIFPNNSTGVPTPGKELFFNFSPQETAQYGIQINEVSNNSFISYLFKEDSGASACDPNGWTGLARVNGPMVFDIGILEAGKTYKFVMAAEDTVSTRHSFILFQHSDLECPEDQELCINSDPVALQGEGEFTGPGVTDGHFDPSSAGEGVHEITYMLGEQSCSFFITVFRLPEIICPPSQSFCIDVLPFKITGGSPSGGTYFGAGVTDGDFDPQLAGPGEHVITYTFEDENGCENSCSFEIAVHELPEVACPPDMSFCIESEPFELSGGTPSGGNYTGTGVNDGIFDPQTAGPGDHSISYNFEDEDGCENSCSFVLTVQDLPMLTCPSDMSFCADDAPFNITGGLPLAGTYSGPGVTDGDFDPQLSGPGDHVVTYTFEDENECVSSCSFIITVHALSSVTCPDNFETCITDATIYPLEINDYPNGIFTGSGVSLTGSLYVFTPSQAELGENTITFNALDQNGCALSCSFTAMTIPGIELTDLPNQQYCNSSTTVFPLSVSDYPDGVFSGPGVSLINGQYFFSPSVLTPGDYTILFEATSSGCIVSGTILISVVGPEEITCPENFEVPFNSNAAYPLSLEDYPDGIFEGPGVTFSDFVYSFQPSGANLGQNIINFSAQGPDGCLLTCSFIITTTEEGPCPDIDGELTGDQLVCPNDEVWLTVNISGGEAPYLVQIQDPDGNTLSFSAADVGQSVFHIENPLNGVYILVNAFDVNECPATVSGASLVSVEDITPPVAICQDINVAPDEDGNYLFSAIDIDAGSADNCGVADLSIDIDWIACDTATPVTVTLTVTDVSGNTDTCMSTVTPEGDSDCDGVGDSCDLCPGGDDSIDNNGDGLPDCYYYPGAEFLPASWTCSNNPNNEKVRICHNGNSLCVSENAIPAFIEIGAYIGPCGNANCGEPGESLLEVNPSVHTNMQFIKDGFTAYPNPSNGTLIVVMEEVLENGIFHILDMHGTTKLTVAVAPGLQELKLDVHQFAAGTYIIRLQTDNVISSKKLMIIKH